MLNQSANDQEDHPIPSGLDPDVLHRSVTHEGLMVNLHDMLHKGSVRQFTFHSDEPPELGGQDEHPRPLDYLLAGVGFCILTQIVRYGRMLKVEYTDARVRVRGHWTSEGSVLAGTINSQCQAIETHVEIESDDEPAHVAALIRNAKNGCYAESTVTAATPLHSTVQLNGKDFDAEQYPRKLERR